MKKIISIITPAMNEQDNLTALYNELRDSLNNIKNNYEWELIIVNDGSTDNTETVIDELSNLDSRVKGLHLARNFGHQPALLAGLEKAIGEIIITIDADLQQPPSTILKMISKWEEGFKVVHGVRQDHPNTSFFKKQSSKYFYKLFSFLSRIQMEPGMLDFRLLDRQVVDAVLSMPESDFFLRGISTWIGFKQSKVLYQSNLRHSGKTKYSFNRMLSFALRGITSFSTFPLKLATYLGLIMTLISLCYGSYVSIRHFFWEHPNPAYASTILLISFLMGVQFLLIGMLGEYVSRIHFEVKKRPRYFIARVTDNSKEIKKDDDA